MTTPDDVLAFWFGLPPAKWWAKDDAFDADLRARFGETLEAGWRGELDDWKDTPRGRLALVIVFDQFSRNIHRGTMKMFRCDQRALALTTQGLARGDDAKLEPMERYFLLMPLMHAEDASLQRRSVEEFEKLRASAPEALAKSFDDAVTYARRHAEIVERFGRFPHRNAILGRPSRPEEEAFLREPNSSF